MLDEEGSTWKHLSTYSFARRDYEADMFEIVAVNDELVGAGICSNRQNEDDGSECYVLLRSEGFRHDEEELKWVCDERSSEPVFAGYSSPLRLRYPAR